MAARTAGIASELLASGGDARIVVDADTGTNRYFATPWPRDTVTYASSTANDISPEAFAHVCAVIENGQPGYAAHLAQLRARLRAAYGLADDIDVVFAASGTDLEYVALAAVIGKAAGGVHNVLIGADEVGSGCIHSAHGRYFAQETARGIAVAPGETVAGLEAVGLTDIPVRAEDGTARSSEDIAAAVDAQISEAERLGKHALVHVVHGSKTGLILPRMNDLVALQRRWGKRASFVVDACQARLGEDAARAYLEAGCILLVTGSKFMGGPPFSGMALLPPGLAKHAAPLPLGLATIFRKAEWPLHWPGADALPDEENPGLALRIEAAVYELERFHALPPGRRAEVAELFQNTVRSALVEPLGLEQVLPTATGNMDESDAHPTAMKTLVTLSLAGLPGVVTLADAERLHRQLVTQGVRLGQPVKCVRLPDGEWGATLRVGLSMPQASRLAAMADGDAIAALMRDMQRIASALSGQARPS
ncbi:hypothetical protein GRI62_05440 [Erythrobacter arachoides]|uniref:Aminotransferase class V domain-containing protein n=1 Tax=Aurantiacibacter arachoides TaxID=1850444 RepID=A0A844ZZA4_9SPHN|nr:hypothetical protein [Aurantiacibacter arachoides]MXO93048.1 hypothetical protein [Aurantiacibacter arachoides]GGD52424.1 hypothetical protein GCM10011411_10380 [Aurantiacibacter arachoides]